MPLVSKPLRFPDSTFVLVCSSDMMLFCSFSNFGEPPLINRVCLLSVNDDPFVMLSFIITSGTVSIFCFACTSDSRGPSLCGSKSRVSFLFLYKAEVILGLVESVGSLDLRRGGSSVLKRTVNIKLAYDSRIVYRVPHFYMYSGVSWVLLKLVKCSFREAWPFLETNLSVKHIFDVLCSF